eukprot:2138849-Rhodomonas_salina.1
MLADRGSVFTFCHGTSSGTEARYVMWSNPGSPEKRPVASSMETAARPQTCSHQACSPPAFPE